MGSNPGTDRYIVARMTTLNGGPLSLGPITSGRLKNLQDVDKWSSLSLYLPVRGMSVTCELGAVPVQSDGFNSALSPVVYGDIMLSINTLYNTILKVCGDFFKRVLSSTVCRHSLRCHIYIFVFCEIFTGSLCRDHLPVFQ